MPITSLPPEPTADTNTSALRTPSRDVLFTALVLSCGGLLLGLRSLASDSPHVSPWITVAGWCGTLLGTLVVIFAHRIRLTAFRFRILRTFAVMLACASILLFSWRVYYGLSHIHLLSCSDDSAVTVVAGGSAILSGQNPYESWNNPKELLAKCNVVTFTLLRTGRFAGDYLQPSQAAVQQITKDILHGRTPQEVLSSYFYPIGNGLLGIFGAPAVILISAASALVIVGFIIMRAPKAWRGMILLTTAAQLPFWGQFGVLNAAPFAFLLLLPAWFWPSSKGAAISTGLASAVRQIPWLSIPALLGLAWAQSGFRKAFRAGIILVATFLVVSLPFMWHIPAKWFHDVIAQQLVTIPNGAGLVTLFSSKLLPAVLAKCLSVLETLLTVLAGVIAIRSGSTRPERAALCSGLAIWAGPVSYAAHMAPVGMFVLLAYWGNILRAKHLTAPTV